jgi:uncharacterized protein with gpF-like domain
MARRETHEPIANRLEPRVRRAFLESIATIRADAQIGQIVRALESNDIDRALRMLNIDRAHFGPLERSLRAAFEESGDAITAALMAQAKNAGVQVRGVFDASNPRAQRFVQEQSSRLITEITEDMREAARTLMVANMQAQTAPRATALDLVGRINRATGKRHGGIIGLHSRDAEAAQTALRELRVGPSTEEGRQALRNYLSRKTRDRRFDATVRRAIREGTPVPDDKARRMIASMENRMLRNRGETIARTELLSSTNAAQEEGLEQLVESGKAQRKNVKSKWDSSEDGATRPSHSSMDGQVRQQGEPFTTGNGYQLMHPGDRSQGAPAEEIINCRCVKRPRVDWIAEAAEQERELT